MLLRRSRELTFWHTMHRFQKHLEKINFGEVRCIKYTPTEDPTSGERIVACAVDLVVKATGKNIRQATKHLDNRLRSPDSSNISTLLEKEQVHFGETAKSYAVRVTNITAFLPLVMSQEDRRTYQTHIHKLVNHVIAGTKQAQDAVQRNAARRTGLQAAMRDDLGLAEEERQRQQQQQAEINQGPAADEAGGSASVADEAPQAAGSSSVPNPQPAPGSAPVPDPQPEPEPQPGEIPRNAGSGMNASEPTAADMSVATLKISFPKQLQPFVDAIKQNSPEDMKKVMDDFRAHTSQTLAAKRKRQDDIEREAAAIKRKIEEEDAANKRKIEEEDAAVKRKREDDLKRQQAESILKQQESCSIQTFYIVRFQHGDKTYNKYGKTYNFEERFPQLKKMLGCGSDISVALTIPCHNADNMEQKIKNILLQCGRKRQLRIKNGQKIHVTQETYEMTLDENREFVNMIRTDMCDHTFPCTDEIKMQKYRDRFSVFQQ